jgi:hypothetical protein
MSLKSFSKARYRAWLAALFMTLFRQASNEPNIMEGIIKGISKTRQFSTIASLVPLVSSALKFTLRELTCAETGTENVPALAAISTVPRDTNGVFWTAPDREICVVSVVKEKINEEFEKDSGFEDPIGVKLPDPTPWNVIVIVMFTASDEPTRSELGFLRGRWSNSRTYHGLARTANMKVKPQFTEASLSPY